MKVVIIGGGICGLYLSWKLSKAGHNVSVFERKSEIGNKICSGLFSERILDFIPKSKILIQNTIKSAVLRFPKKTINLYFSKNFFVMSHFEMDKLVAELAKQTGAEIILNSNISSFPKGYDRIIGCDGADSFTRKNLGLPSPNLRLGILGFSGNGSFDNFVEIWPHKENGFIWKIPQGSETEYGIISNPKTANAFLNDFLEKNKIILMEKAAKIIPCGFSIPRNKTITVCGDAAGLAKNWSGGGVIWGLTAANILLKNFPDFLKYEKEAAKFFKPKIIISKFAAKAVYYFGFNFPYFFPKRAKMESDFLF
ncbi:MAG: hypothetical protein A3C48_03130 [Candidatus Nealsonbacteria bacterium RIFCSPHIGHO2_02_FULL_38_75]|nr:MAG: hypothetical protein A3C48_03130 [Candidatus Nealsonbacteria bacterium RIFCSPHIGHO2_02_FULL_38_75]OGZ23767.1 MAG: hypothetical protein A2981_02220 [Candidatus Nealsonbacteria bacterium RIFCSPLOWO2_01_FULL_38_120]